METPSAKLLGSPAWKMRGLSTKARRLLQGHLNGCAVIDLIQLDEKYGLMPYRGYGRKTANEIEHHLKTHGLRLGMSVPEIISWSILYDVRAPKEITVNLGQRWPLANLVIEPGFTQDELRQIYYGEPDGEIDR